MPGLDIVEPDLGDHNGDHEELASKETGNLPELHQPPDGGTSVLGSEELDGLYEDADDGEDFDASSDVDPRFGEGFSHISSDFSLLNLQFYLKTGDHAHGLTLPEKISRIQEHISAFSIDTEPWARTLQTSVTATDINESLTRFVIGDAEAEGSNMGHMDHIADLCDIIQTFCHLTDLRKFPNMTQEVLGAYVAIFLEGNFGARAAMIKRNWRQ